MINANVGGLLGFVCHYLNELGTVAAIDTPFVFPDGDPIPVYVEQVDEALRFFDDGGVIWHFTGLGIRLDEPGDEKFIEDLAKLSGVALNANGELEIWTDVKRPHAAFAQYISAMFAFIRWEEERTAEECRRREPAVVVEAFVQVCDDPRSSTSGSAVPRSRNVSVE